MDTPPDVVKPVRIEEVLARLDTHVRNARTAREALRQVEAQAAESPSEAGHARVLDAALTPREMEVLTWVARGKTNRDIAEILGMSHRTVNKHLEHVFEKLGVETRSAAAAIAGRLLPQD